MHYTDLHFKAIGVTAVIGIVFGIVTLLLGAGFFGVIACVWVGISLPSALRYAIDNMSWAHNLFEDGLFYWLVEIISFLAILLGSVVLAIAPVKSFRILLLELQKIRAAAGNEVVQQKLSSKAHELFEEGKRVLNEKGRYHAKVWFESAAKLGHEFAKKELLNIKNAEAAEYAQRKSSEEQRLRNLPKCPACGAPIESRYINEYWGFRYHHATYGTDCSWSDNKLREPYRPL